MIRSLLTFASLLAPTHAVPRYELSAAFVAESVQRALPDAMRSVAAPSVTLLANPYATEPEPALEVRSVEALDSARSRVRLQCHEAAVCLPFYAIIDRPMTHRTAMSQPQSRVASLLRAGTLATLFFDDDRAHIRVPVITLQPGSVGQRIRVTSPDRRHIWLAEVVSATELKGSL